MHELAAYDPSHLICQADAFSSTPARIIHANARFWLTPCFSSKFCSVGNTIVPAFFSNNEVKILLCARVIPFISVGLCFCEVSGKWVLLSYGDWLGWVRKNRYYEAVAQQRYARINAHSLGWEIYGEHVRFSSWRMYEVVSAHTIQARCNWVGRRNYKCSLR